MRIRCTYSFEALREQGPVALRSCPIDIIRKFIRKAWRFYDAYHKKLSGPFAAFVVKKYKSHRCIPDDLDEALLRAEFEQRPDRFQFQC